MRNKKWSIAPLVLTGALLMSGCGETNEIGKEDAFVSEELVQTEENGDKTETISSGEITPEQKVEDGKEEQKEQNMPVVTIEPVRKEWYDNEQETLILEAQTSLVHVENEGFDALKQALAERFCGAEGEVYETLLEKVKVEYEATKEENAFFPTDCMKDYLELARCDSSVLSFRSYFQNITGRADGIYGYEGVTFDVETGKELAISDIVTDEEGFYTQASAYITDKLCETEGIEISSTDETKTGNLLSKDSKINWYFNVAGIVIIYNLNELGEDSDRIVEVVLPYQEFANYIDSKYVTMSDVFVAKVNANEEMTGLVGESSKLCLKTEWNEYDMLDVSISLGEKEEQIGEFGSYQSAYFIRREDGRSFLAVTCDAMSDDYTTSIYEVTADSIQKCDELSGARITGCYITTEKIEMSQRLDVLGTYFAKTDYSLDENGKCKQAEELFTIESLDTLTVIKPLPAVVEGEEVLLNTDTRIKITGTNNLDAVYFEVPETKATGIIYYELDEEGSWIHMIDGVPEYEYFEMLPYAG